MRTWIGPITNTRRLGPRPTALLVAGQGLFALRVALRLLRSVGGQRIESARSQTTGEHIAVVVPVLDECGRLAPCLEGLLAQGPEVGQILVVDGGSTDGTPDLVRAFAEHDPRVHLIDAAPVPSTWNGKAWGLQAGLEASDPRCGWMLTLDADVRPAPGLAAALLDHARSTGLDALSAATLQQIEGTGEALLHPSLLTTLVYRFGSPGKIITRVRDVQANGQCFLARRPLLLACGGFAVARASRCEDITLARALVAGGVPIGFYEAGDLVSVRMYAGWREAWRNWPRSLPMRDQFSRWSSLIGLCEVSLVQALPLPLFAWLQLITRRDLRSLRVLNGMLALVRLGVLMGTARAYQQRPWSYWLSPLCDLPVACRLWLSALGRTHTWRGRVLVEGARS